jgi:hypothetical protein
MRLSIRHLNSLVEPILWTRLRANEWEMRHRRPGYILDGSRSYSIISSRDYFVDFLLLDLARRSGVMQSSWPLVSTIVRNLEARPIWHFPTGSVIG